MIAAVRFYFPTIFTYLLSHHVTELKGMPRYYLCDVILMIIHTFLKSSMMVRGRTEREGDRGKTGNENKHHDFKKKDIKYQVCTLL